MTAAPPHPLLSESPYQGYVYAYPHKTAYRQLDRPVSLQEAWATESQDALFLYAHIPFCEQRCGFCNLFTASNAGGERIRAYLAALAGHVAAVREALSEAKFARIAVGGGTPTLLGATELAALFDLFNRELGASPFVAPTSVESSPATATADRLTVLRERGVERLSIGVQTFDAIESKRLGRTQPPAMAHEALHAIREAGFPILNIDLIYGGDLQTPTSFVNSIDAALEYAPEEIYLYPLYVRPLTGLAKLQREWDSDRLELYRIGRDRLRNAGYEQVSMRFFRRADQPVSSGPDYCCQRDGMVGVGVAARSYTRSLHYASEYAVGRPGVVEIIDAYCAQSQQAFGQIEYGVELNAQEQRRRWLLKSLLRCEGAALQAYRHMYDAELFTDFPSLGELIDTGLASADSRVVRLTKAGIERSDAIGPWLYSEAMIRRMEQFDWR